MNTLPVDLYNVLDFGLGGIGWQEFIDNYADKYNDRQIGGFEFDPVKLDYTFNQLITSLGVKTLPSYVDPESPGYEAALNDVEGKVGNIPTQKKFYRLNRVAVRQQMQLIQRVGAAAMTEQMQMALMALIDEGSDGLITSYYNALTHQRMRIVSTGKFTISTDNNPRGINGVTIDFGIANSHFDTLASTKRWWTAAEHTTANEGSASDPLGYLKERVKAIRRTYHYYGKLAIEISQDLWDDLLTHSKVLAQIGYSLYPTSASDAAAVGMAKYVGDEQKMDIIKKIVRVDAIFPRDTFAFVDKPGTGDDGAPDLVTVQVENFNSKNVAFIPMGKIGTIQGVEPLTLGYDADKVASFNEGRLKLTRRAIAETHSLYIESEAAQLCVPSVPQYMFISTVTA